MVRTRATRLAEQTSTHTARAARGRGRGRGRGRARAATRAPIRITVEEPLVAPIGDRYQKHLLLPSYFRRL